MTTTIVRDSKVGDAWITEMRRLNPPAVLYDEKGQPTGNATTGLVRLSWTNGLLTAQPTKKGDPNSTMKFSTDVLWCPGEDLTVLWNLLFACVAQNWPQNQWNPGLPVPFYDGLRNPFRAQAEKSMKLAGYTNGGLFTSLSSNFRPAVVDPAYNPIVKPEQVHAGVWGIGTVNAYASGKGTPNQGPRFGLQGMMIVADDTDIGAGGAVDPRKVFAGVRVQPGAAPPPAAFAAPPVPTGAPNAAVGSYMNYSAPQPVPGGYPAPPPTPGYGAPAPGYPAPAGLPPAPPSYPAPSYPAPLSDEEELRRLMG